MLDYLPFYTIAPKLVDVTRQEFTDFIVNYPNKLQTDCRLGTLTYNDYSIAPMWPESIVASRNIEFEHDPNKKGYGKIASNIKEVFNSIKKI